MMAGGTWTLNMPPTIAAIPTKYGGIDFRSRAEARWAIFFDDIGIPWMYEPTGYDLDGTKYLPDFWLPDQDAFWEVKPNEHYQPGKARALANTTGKRVYVGFDLRAQFDPQFMTVRGSLRARDSAHVFFPRTTEDMALTEGLGWAQVVDDEGFVADLACDDAGHRFCVCPVCGKWTIQFAGWGLRHCGNYDSRRETDSMVAVSAAKRAYEIRFPSGGRW